MENDLPSKVSCSYHRSHVSTSLGIMLIMSLTIPVELGIHVGSTIWPLRRKVHGLTQDHQHGSLALLALCTRFLQSWKNLRLTIGLLGHQRSCRHLPIKLHHQPILVPGTLKVWNFRPEMTHWNHLAENRIEQQIKLWVLGRILPVPHCFTL